MFISKMELLSKIEDLESELGRLSSKICMVDCAHSSILNAMKKMQQTEKPMFQKGDIVRLISGGFPMTVGHVFDNGEVVCYFATDGDIKRGVYNPSILTKCKKPGAKK